MRKFLLASVATLGAGGLAASAYAQAPAAQGYMQGQAPVAPRGGPSFVNNNNNYQAPALPGPVANPTPGSIVIHVNGKVQVDFQGVWSSVDKRVVTAPAGSPGATPLTPGAATPLGTVLGNNGSGTVSLNPQAIDSFARLYFGADGMATNGLRYGAGIEIRQNFTGQISGGSASGYSSLETLFVRRAFTYVAGEQWGILRAGQADGVIGIFDNGVTTFQFLPSGNLNGGDLQANAPQNATVPFSALGQSGAEYGNAKLVYLSPQIAGFDVGLQYAPNLSNGNGIGTSNPLNSSITGAGTGTGLSCTVANSGCPTLSSGPGSLDGSRVTNQTVIGVRYQGTFAGVGILAYGAYENSGHATYTGAASTTAAGAANLGNTAAVGGTAARFNGNYDGLSFGSGGLALSYAGFTVGGNVIGGRLNGQLALAPQGGAGELGYLVGVKYVAGPFTAGIVGETIWSQGNVNMTGLTQRRARGLDAGVSYTVAPGYTVWAEYMYQDIYQGGVNIGLGTIGTNAGNDIKSQGVMLGNVVNF
ncbi:MAG TPA: hypothetical protein VHT74_35225 [Acetobacteraceae bacterium]|jgi:hypothetical protein|nr:hypothetical protein [Acetobacteraceae bacterium]